MRSVFADTHYWIAIANPNDEWHEAAVTAGKSLGHVRIFTTDEVLAEFLAFFSARGHYWRGQAVKLVRAILANPNISVIPQTRDSFNAGFELYSLRLDKEYSLTDCISMAVMRREELHEVLTHDHHFEQEGFVILITEKAPNN